MEYPRYELKRELSIDKIITFSYRRLKNGYRGVGEKHDFWEFVYIDQGRFEVFTEVGQYELNQGELIFYKPNLFHVGKTRSGETPTLLILAFECAAPCMSFFADRTFRLEEQERQLLSRLVQIGKEAFNPPVDSIRMLFPNRLEESKFGTEQLIINYLEIFLLELIRGGSARRDSVKPASVIQENKQVRETMRLIDYLQCHIAASDLSMEAICSEFAIGRTQLKTMFKAQTGSGVMEYWKRLKIEKAKSMIADDQLNFTEIAEYLGYASVHGFSRQFKKIAGVTPSEYARSIVARLEKSIHIR